MKDTNFIILALLLLSSEAWAQARKPASIAELANYRGADREQVLYAWSKNRRQNNLVHVSRPATRTRKWSKRSKPSIRASRLNRIGAPGADLVTRLEEEAKARRNIADTIETTEGSLIFLARRKIAPSL